ncbi:MAG TPA: helix-turn-helix transcriptional regulator [Slackia equolifaciens]|uniref:Helix-turn-helix transcriptional regulator n=1 Tax=Slackia equolifaciens TaxID=498718 RepID=A0A9D2UXE7_9ACTN|nr:helix-turn-helix transcriptional regulator [Slackia equolifaciens]
MSKQCLSVAEEYGLSSRETEVMELLGRGRTGSAIADELFISENTVRTHIKRIYAKVGVGKKQELLAVLDHAMPS